jgi:hypothetical protein
VDAQNAYQSAYGFVYTSETGYFQLNFAGASGAGQDQAPHSDPASAAAPTPQPFIEIANADGQPVYLASSHLPDRVRSLQSPWLSERHGVGAGGHAVRDGRTTKNRL